MNIRDAFSAKAIALVNKTAGSNKLPYLGLDALFTRKKKNGLDLKWIKTAKGLAVSLAPSNFDAKSTIRSREGAKMDETEMAFFRESMLVKEQDEQEILRAEDSTDPYAKEVLASVFDDANTLVDGADVVPERMIMQLLSPSDGHPKISLQADGVTYAYNYDPSGTYASSNYMAITTATDKWSDTTNSDPMSDVETAQGAIQELTGTVPDMMIVSKQTMRYLKQNTKIKNYVLAQNQTATVIMTDARVKEVFDSELGVKVVVYAKKYKNEAGVAANFYPDGYATLVPSDGQLGNVWYGTTPEERTLMGTKDADVAVTNTGVAIAVKTTNDPVNTKTTVSEIVLPSYERMDETYVIKCY